MGDFLQNSIERLVLHDHVCLFYKNPEERLSVLVSYIRIGLSRGEKCLLYCGEATGKEILEGLRYKGVDIGVALARGAVLATQGTTTRDATRGFSPEELIAFFHSTAGIAGSEKYTGLRLCVDIPFALGKDVPRERFLEYQWKLSSFLAGEKCLCMCLYGLTDSPADMLLDALRAHPFVIHKGRLAGNFYFVPLAGDTWKIEAERVLEQRLDHLVERHDQLARIQRQALRLTRFRDIAASLLSHPAIPDLLSRIAEGVVSLGYRMCWVGMAKTDGSTEPVASAGDKEGYLQEVSVRWDDTPMGNGPVGLAIREGKPQIVRDVSHAPQFSPWRKHALERGYLSVAAIPIQEGNKVVGALAVYAGAHDAFSREAIDELVAFVLQASLALQRVREYRDLSFSEERFRRLFDQIPAACFTYDIDGNIRDWNQHCLRFFDYSREEGQPECHAAGAYPKGAETIFIVDDEPVIREMGEELLTALGYRTIVAEDGETACRIFRQRGKEISLVLLDVIMPKMGGRETFHTLRKLAPGLPVLLSSGYSVEGLAQKILDEGANGFIRKPYGLQEISRMIRSILDKTRPNASGQAGTGA